MAGQYTNLRGTPHGRLAQEWTYEVGFAIQRDMSKAIAKTIATGARNHYLTELDRMFNVKKLARQRARAHSVVAESMARAVQAEVASMPRGETYPSPRRSRLSGGLARAVNDPGFAFGDQFGIHFMDRDLMNKEARHWQRLNFGTGAAQRPAMIAKPKLGDRQLLDVTIKPIAVGGGSTLANPRIPQGFFWHGGDRKQRMSEFRGMSTGRPFNVTRPDDFKETSPIKPKGFMNAGLAAFEVALPTAYRDLVQQYGRQAGSQKKMIPVKA